MDLQDIKKRIHKDENGINNVSIEEMDWLIKRAEKADQYEDLALDHQYQTILDEMD